MLRHCRVLIAALVLLPPAFSQQCNFRSPTGGLTATGPDAAYHNNTTQPNCNAFALTWNSTGFSAITIELQGSDDNSSWTTFTGTSTVTVGTNPASTLSGAIVVQASATLAYLRVNLTSATGTGAVNYQVYGYNGVTPTAKSGGSGSSTTWSSLAVGSPGYLPGTFYQVRSPAIIEPTAILGGGIYATQVVDANDLAAIVVTTPGGPAVNILNVSTAISGTSPVPTVTIGAKTISDPNVNLLFTSIGSTGFVELNSACLAAGTMGIFTVGTGCSIVRSGTGVVDANQLLSVPFCTGFTPTNGQFLQYTTGGSPNPCYSAAAAGSSAFSALTSGTNTTAAMLVGSGASLGTTGTGTISANQLNAVPFCTGFTPTTLQFLQYTTASSPNPCYTAATVSGGSLPSGTGPVAVHSSVGVLGTAHDSALPLTCADSSGSGTTQSCTTSPTFTLATGDAILYSTTTTNTGDVTIAVNGGAAVHVRKWQANSTLAAGDLKSGVVVPMTYDGTYWEVGGNIGNPPTGGGGNPFYGGSITPIVSANWSNFGAGCTRATVTGVTGGTALQVVSTSSAYNICGYSTTVAAGDFSHVFTFYSLLSNFANATVEVGFTDGTNAEWCGIGSFNGTPGNIGVATYTVAKANALTGGTVSAGNGVNATYNLIVPNSAGPVSIRLRRTGTALACDISPDNVTWTNYFNDTVPFLTASSVYFAADPRSAGFVSQGILESFQ